MERILVTSRRHANRLRHKGALADRAVLSIHGHNEPRMIDLIARGQAVWHERVCFDDVTNGTCGTPISPDQAAFIRRWCLAAVEHPRLEELIIHCEAGMSRSVAVGLWLGEATACPVTLPPQAVGGAFANALVASRLRTAD